MVFSIVSILIRCIVGGLFVVAALLKYRSGVPAFAHQIKTYQLIPDCFWREADELGDYFSPHTWGCVFGRIRYTCQTIIKETQSFF